MLANTRHTSHGPSFDLISWIVEGNILEEWVTTILGFVRRNNNKNNNELSTFISLLPIPTCWKYLQLDWLSKELDATLLFYYCPMPKFHFCSTLQFCPASFCIRRNWTPSLGLSILHTEAGIIFSYYEALVLFSFFFSLFFFYDNLEPSFSIPYIPHSHSTYNIFRKAVQETLNK